MSDLGSQADINDVYRERNIVVALAFSLAYNAQLDIAAYADPADPDWIVVFIELGEYRQVSWHLPRAEFDAWFPNYYQLEIRNPWDGHTTAEKERRITEYVLETFA